LSDDRQARDGAHKIGPGKGQWRNFRSPINGNDCTNRLEIHGGGL